MKFDVEKEWRNFEAALIQELQKAPIEEFEKAWKSLPARTQFYRNWIIPKVAERLNYKPGYEHLSRDYVLLNNERVPVVFIESENNHRSASHEIEKLCATSAPVKVLLLCCAWTNGEREKCFPDWKKRIETHHKYLNMDAVYMIIVGEWGFKYTLESFHSSKSEINKVSTVIRNRT